MFLLKKNYPYIFVCIVLFLYSCTYITDPDPCNPSRSYYIFYINNTGTDIKLYKPSDTIPFYNIPRYISLKNGESAKIRLYGNTDVQESWYPDAYPNANNVFIKTSNNRCINNKGILKGTTYIVNELKEIDEECGGAVYMNYLTGTGVYDYRRYTYTRYTDYKIDSVSGNRVYGEITYTFTPSDTVGSVICSF